MAQPFRTQIPSRLPINQRINPINKVPLLMSLASITIEMIRPQLALIGLTQHQFKNRQSNLSLLLKKQAFLEVERKIDLTHFLGSQANLRRLKRTTRLVPTSQLFHKKDSEPDLVRHQMAPVSYQMLTRYLSHPLTSNRIQILLKMMQINLVKIKSKMKLEQASALDSVDSMLKRNNLLQVIF